MIKKIVFLAALGSAVACSEGEMTNGQKAAGPLEVDVAVMKPEPIVKTLNTVGSLLAEESANITSQLNGRIASIQFSEGERVRRGDVLIQIDDQIWKAQRNRLLSQKSFLEKQLDRDEQLVVIGGVTQEEMDQRESELEQVMAQLKEVETNIEYATIRAPFDGVIGLRNHSVGDYVMPGEMITTVEKISTLKVEFDVPERMAYEVQKGQLLICQIEGLQSEFVAEVYATSSSIDPNTRSLKVRARIKNTQEQLIPGAFANIQITLDSISDALMVPAESVVPELNKQIVWVLRDGIAQKSSIDIGVRTPSRVQVTSGVEIGDSVLTTGLMQVRQGTPAKVRNIVEVVEKSN